MEPSTFEIRSRGQLRWFEALVDLGVAFNSDSGNPILRLKGRGIVITGASHGLGRAIAEACLREGADVFLCARERDALEAAVREITPFAGSQKVFWQLADVADPEHVKRLIEAAGRQLPRFSGLVNNAGMYGPMGTLEAVEWEQWVRTIQVNLLGTVLACREAVPHFRRAGYGKIVNLSGGGATSPMPRISAYAASKAAVVRFTESLALEVQDARIDVNALAPGALNTRMLDEVLTAGPEKVGRSYYDRATKQRDEGGAPPEKGADLCTYLLSPETDGITGRLISAVWDSWKDLPTRKDALAKSDVYTLRRILPKDRGFDWE